MRNLFHPDLPPYWLKLAEKEPASWADADIGPDLSNAEALARLRAFIA